MEISLYENAMQVAPVLLIALFLDNRTAPGEGEDVGPGWTRWFEIQNNVIAALNVTSFSLSMFVVAGVLEDGLLLRTIILTTLGGSMGLLGSLVQQRLNQMQKPASGSKEK